MQIYKCDKCGKVLEGTLGNNGWKYLYLQDYCGHHIQYHLCPECAKALNIPEPLGQESEDDIAHRLIEILEEIAQSAVQVSS